MKRTLTGAALALLAWAGIMLAMPFVGPAGRQVAVLGDDAERAVAQSGGRIVARRGKAVLAYAAPLALYRHGATLVIEGRIAASCVSFSRR